MATEKQIQEAVQTALLSMSEFDAGDVTINDFDVMDKAADNAPYAIIMNSENFDSRQDTKTVTGTWNVQIRLVVKLAELTWKTALDNFRDARQAIVDKIAGSVRSGNTLPGLDIKRVYAGGGLNFIYDGYVDAETLANATPAFVSQDLILESELF